MASKQALPKTELVTHIIISFDQGSLRHGYAYIYNVKRKDNMGMVNDTLTGKQGGNKSLLEQKEGTTYESKSSTLCLLFATKFEATESE